MSGVGADQVGSARRGRPGARWLSLGLAAALVAQALRNREVIPAGLGPDDLFCHLLFALAATGCWLRGRVLAAERVAWRLMALALVSYLAGDLYARWVLHGRVVSPSVPDACWLGFYGLAFAAILAFNRARSRRPQTTLWLDGAIGGFGAAALVAAFAFEPLAGRSPGHPLLVATNLAYPVADVLLVFLLVAAGTTARAADRSWWLLSVSLALYCAGDIAYLVATSAGSYPVHPRLWELSWAVGVALVGWAALGRTPYQRGHAARPEPYTRFHYTTPVLFTATSVGLLVYGQRRPLPVVAVVLTVVALALATAKVALAVRSSVALAASRGEARTDELTGLPNRRHVAELIASAVAAAGREPVSVIVLDLDRFKDINDSLGQVAGDLVLEQVARRLRDSVGSIGTLARLGGDEFAVLLPGRDSAEAVTVARWLRSGLVEPVQLAGLPVSVQASMGVASAPPHGQSALELLSRADIAMYQAKRSSAGIATFRVEHGNPSRERLELLADLRHALATDAFALHYQPQIHLMTGEVSGVEALIRWEHPTRGTLHPAQFLPMVNETGLMSELTRLALRRARADWAWLRGLGAIPRMSVNITAADLSDDAFPAAVEALLGPGGFTPNTLVLEVTEDDVLRDRPHGHALLQHLRDLGCLIAVDDYGTGQASLSYLRDLPLDEIKLDQTFIRGATTDTHNAAITRSTIELAHILGLPIVAEGIEDQPTQDWLRQLGCDTGQGYHIGRPMTVTSFAHWLGHQDTAERPSPVGPAG